jgi:hypothetical protein
MDELFVCGTAVEMFRCELDLHIGAGRRTGHAGAESAFYDTVHGGRRSANIWTTRCGTGPGGSKDADVVVNH